MEETSTFYERKKEVIQNEIAEIELRIETYVKADEDLEIIEKLKSEKLKLESKLRKVIREEQKRK